MTLSPFSNLSPAVNSLPAVVAVNVELVRGIDSQVINDLLPRVKQESVALDLSAVPRIDAAGIATLITLYCSSVRAGTDFSVVAPSQHVLDMLRTVGLESILVANHNRDNRKQTTLADCGCPAA